MRFAGVMGLVLVALTAGRLHAGPPAQGGDDFPGSGPSDPWATKARQYARDFRDGGIGAQPGFSDAASFFASAAKNIEQGHRPAAGWETKVPPPGAVSRVAARVNGEDILDEEVRAVAFQELAAASSNQEKARILNARREEIIEREAVVQLATILYRLNRRGRVLEELQAFAAKEFDRQWLQPMMACNHYTDRQRFERFLGDGGLRLDLFRRAWERTFIAREFLNAFLEPEMARVTLAEVVRYYRTHDEEFTRDDEVEWQDLFIAVGRHPSRQAAREVAATMLTRIDNGEDFSSLARAYDNGDSALRPGAQGIGCKRGEIRPVQLQAPLFRLTAGKASLIEMENGFHVVKVVKRRHAGKQPLDYKVQMQIYMAPARPGVRARHESACRQVARHDEHRTGAGNVQRRSGSLRRRGSATRASRSIGQEGRAVCTAVFDDGAVEKRTAANGLPPPPTNTSMAKEREGTDD